MAKKLINTVVKLGKGTLLPEAVTENLFLLNEVPVGELVIWEGNRLIQYNGSYQSLGVFYMVNEHLNIKFPNVNGFTKKYRMELTYTDNKPGTGKVYVHVENNPSTWSYDFLFEPTWGGIEDGIRRIGIVDIPQNVFNNLPSWWKIFGTPDFANGGAVRYYKISILVYYKPM